MEESVNVECSLPATEGSRHVRAYSCRKFLLIPDHGGIVGSFIAHSPWRNQLIWSAHGQLQRGHVMSYHVRAYSCIGIPLHPDHGVIGGSFIPHSPWRNQLIWSAHCQPLRGHVTSGPIHVGSLSSSQTMERSRELEGLLPAA